MRQVWIFATGTLFWAQLAHAQQCAIDPLAQYLIDPQTLATTDQLSIQAENFEGDYTRAVFSGKVNVQFGQQALRAEELIYHPETGTAAIPQSALYANTNLVVEGSNLTYHSPEQSALLHGAAYVLRQPADQSPNLTQGSAAQIHHQPPQTQLHQASWSSCQRLNPTWALYSERLLLDHQTQRAHAYGLHFKIKDYTVFYLPYFSYPLSDERQSGFLLPSFNSSSAQGVGVRVPYYFNLAPNYDATISLNLMSKRGLMLGAETRYLDPKQSALLQGDFIADQHTDTKRFQWQLQHHFRDTVFGQPLEARTLYQSLSDPAYPQDFDLPNTRYAESYLPRYLQLDYHAHGHWQLRLADYLPAHPNALAITQPYARLPQLRYQNQWSFQDLQLALHAEATRFYRHHRGHSKRFDVELSAWYRLERPYGFFEPRLRLRHTHYDLSPELGGKRLSRTLPTFSLDAGLIFERRGERYTQTLEPRLYYLYTPYRDQSALPLFDTDERHKSWAWLFLPNRFTGADRIGDAHQITTALSTRWFDQQTGEEKARYQIGQIQYFQAPKTHISLRSALADRQRSLVVADLNYHINPRLSLNALAFYDTSRGKHEYQSLDLRYEIQPKRFVALSRRYDRLYFNQYGLSSVWQWNDRYTTFARIDYSHSSRAFHNIMLGLEFNDCCLSWRLIGKHYRKHPSNNEKHNALYLEFVFKGLGAMGNQTSRLLQQEIHGFQP